MTTKAPSFKDLSPASAQSSLAKRANRNRDTKHELLLRRTLWRMGLRYRKNVTSLPGKPDIVFSKAKLAVFCDGDFWHGRNWRSQVGKLRKGSNASYWTVKIKTNRQRDRWNTLLLEKRGWKVLRFWETDILSDPFTIAEQISKEYNKRLG